MARVIVMDDEQSMRDMVRQMLTKDGHQVTIASDGGEGLKTMRGGGFDLAIIDILMPGKDGIETMIEIKRSYPTTKIIAMSGGRRGIKASFNLDSAVLMGADATLPKPFEWPQLRSAVQKLGL
ncbi:response regulator [Ectothiorhodospiraceae bacterium BW-2]|nr:response regulator [Ectothiorhodospiraceae bacterium BW-2]